MSTRTVTLSTEERHLLIELVSHEWQRAEDRRLTSRPESPQELAAMADKEKIEALKSKLR